MGINWHNAKFIAEFQHAGYSLGEVATIGRQNMHVPPPKVRALLDHYRITHNKSDRDIVTEDGFCEPFLRSLGATRTESLDASEYEGATIVADMNAPIPAALQEKFDTVLDGGTIEHVFDIKLCLANEMEMVKEGGHLIIATMANNWLGHGFYQFSPELFYRVFSEQNGFRIIRMVMHEAPEYSRWYEIPDPAEVRSRIELSNAWLGVGIIVHAQRIAIKPLFSATPQQSDYAVSWDANDVTENDASYSMPLPVPSFKRKIINTLKRRLPGLLAFKHRILIQNPSIATITSQCRSMREHKRRSFVAQPDKFRVSYPHVHKRQ